jgi:hypothetical protein
MSWVSGQWFLGSRIMCAMESQSPDNEFSCSCHIGGQRQILFETCNATCQDCALLSTWVTPIGP